MKWEWKLIKAFMRLKCWFTTHRYDVIKYSGWERAEWQCSKCGGEMSWKREII